MNNKREPVQVSCVMWIIIFAILIPYLIFMMNLSIKFDLRRTVNKDQPAYEQLEKYQEKYVTTKKVPVKYIEYTKNKESFIFWTKKQEYIKVFYPKDAKDIPKSVTFEKDDIKENYKIADKKHKSGTKNLIFTYQTYVKDTPKSIKEKLETNDKNIFQNFGPEIPAIDDLEFIIYQDTKE